MPNSLQTKVLIMMNIQSTIYSFTFFIASNQASNFSPKLLDKILLHLRQIFFLSSYISWSTVSHFYT